MKLLIIDTETTDIGDDAQICEVAATLYQIASSERETGAIASISTLLPVEENGAESINGICWELTQQNSSLYNPDLSIDLLKEMAGAASYATAFNAAFDAPFVNRLIGQQQWLCAMTDFQWNYPKVNFRLIDLALWLGIGVTHIHRAADDVRLLVECLNRRKHMLLEMAEVAIARSTSPLIELEALVNYDNRFLAKDAYFRWDGTRRIWVRKIKACDAPAFVDSLSFGVKAV